MKLLLGTLLLMGTLYGAKIDDYAQKMGFYRDYASALSVAKKENKPLMLVIVADYCPWCRKMERRTLANKEIKVHLDKEVIVVMQDKKYDQGKFPQEFETPRNPTIFFIDPKSGEHFYETIGFVKSSVFAEDLAHVQKEFRK